MNSIEQVWDCSEGYGQSNVFVLGDSCIKVYDPNCGMSKEIIEDYHTFQGKLAKKGPIEFPLISGNYPPTFTQRQVSLTFLDLSNLTVSNVVQQSQELGDERHLGYATNPLRIHGSSLADYDKNISEQAPIFTELRSVLKNHSDPVLRLLGSEKHAINAINIKVTSVSKKVLHLLCTDCFQNIPKMICGIK